MPRSEGTAGRGTGLHCRADHILSSEPSPVPTALLLPRTVVTARMKPASRSRVAECVPRPCLVDAQSGVSRLTRATGPARRSPQRSCTAPSATGPCQPVGRPCRLAITLRTGVSGSATPLDTTRQPRLAAIASPPGSSPALWNFYAVFPLGGVRSCSEPSRPGLWQGQATASAYYRPFPDATVKDTRKALGSKRRSESSWTRRADPRESSGERSAAAARAAEAIRGLWARVSRSIRAEAQRYRRGEGCRPLPTARCGTAAK